MKIFDIKQSFSTESLDFSSVEHVGYYSRNKNQSEIYWSDLSELKYLVIPQSGFCFDLLEGYTSEWKKEEDKTTEGFNCRLKWILQNLSSLQNRVTGKIDIDFVSNRGLIAKIMKTPYSDEFEFQAVKYKGTIYIHECGINPVTSTVMTDYCSKSIFAGYRFETFVTKQIYAAKHRSNAIPAMLEHSFNVVVKSKIGSYTLLYSAEVDANKTANPKVLDFVELKTKSEREREENFNRNKTMSWWTQSRLVGINTIVCGIRDDDFKVKRIRVYPLQELLDSGRRFWNANVCINFLDKFLNFVKECVAEDNVTYKFKRETSSNIVCTILEHRDMLIPDFYRNVF